ncbi:MAG: class I SAM-dependent methyltransferase [Rhodospirillales bacterium]
MNDFTLEWLALREPVDHRSRSPRITQVVRDWAQARWSRTGRPLTIVDLGAGHGSNCRYLAERLPLPQRWHLVDRNPGVLEAAAERLDRSRSPRGLPTTTVAIELHTLDLAVADLPRLLADADLVTCSALLDLVSDDWCRRLVHAAARPGHALLATLTYDGRMRWAMADQADAAMVRLINQHHRSDKGFGPAVGPEALACFEAAVAETGGTGIGADSDWVLGPDEAAMQATLLPLWAGAAREIAPQESGQIDAWLERRRASVTTIGSLLVVGHRDQFVSW